MAPGLVLMPPRYQPLDNNGLTVPGGKLHFFTAGTTNPQNTYFDADLAAGHENTNPVVLDAAGRCIVYMLPSPAYKVVLADPDNVVIWTQDNVISAAGSATLSGVNTGDVTLEGSLSYLTLVDQVLTMLPVDLQSDIASRLLLANLVQASAISKLLGRGSAAGAGDFQEIGVGAGLEMSTTTLRLLAATAASVLMGRGSFAGAGDFEELTVGPRLEIVGTVLDAAAGYKVASGVHTQVSAQDDVVTGLTTVVAVALTPDALTVKQLFFVATIGDQSGAPAAGSIRINSKKPTAVNDVTPIAATDFTDNIGLNWIAVGT